MFINLFSTSLRNSPDLIPLTRLQLLKCKTNYCLEIFNELEKLKEIFQTPNMNKFIYKAFYTSVCPSNLCYLLLFIYTNEKTKVKKTVTFPGSQARDRRRLLTHTV